MITSADDALSDPLEKYPVLGICGSSGAGKTTLIEALIPRLLALRLRVAVVKHGAHNVRVDAPGKDSDRFFQAGADVSLSGEEYFSRRHTQDEGFTGYLRDLCSSYDLVLVEGHARTQVPKIWLLGKGYSAPPEHRGSILEVFTRDQCGVDEVCAFILQRLTRQCLQVPVWGCILIGGKSRRMGRPKHLLLRKGKTWLEHAADKLSPVVDQLVVSGRGQLPDGMSLLARIPDAPGLAGPLAGILTVMRWQPAVSWLIMACDQPDIQPESLQWLLDQRRPGVRAVLPDLQGSGQIEPLLAWYDSRCRRELEGIAASGSLRISRLAGLPGILQVQPPERLHDSWRNVNTPSELNSL